jgi:O-methyltransferase domain/Dimerisation domain
VAERVAAAAAYATEMHERMAKGQLLALARGHRITDMIVTATRLGIPDAIGSEPTDVATIAAATGTHAPTLYRLLRALAATGILKETADRRFTLTEMGSYLRADHPESARPSVEYIGRSHMRDGWANLGHSLRTGENAFTALRGEDVWAWRRHEPEEALVFDRAMASQSAGIGAVVAAAFDFSRRSVVADIGGGSGSVLAGILQATPRLRGILFDQPAVAANPEELERAGVADRCEVVGGSFFEGVPGGADVYLMKAILHDWEDPECVAILRAIRREIPPDGALLLVERVIGPPNEDLEGKLSDLHMLVMPGGRERTEAEWAALLRAGGFELLEIRPIPGPWQLLVAGPAAQTVG